ncbi:MAG: hypothetical protein MUF25_22560 [Pirellulaceae bacterium]|nr:hypothetical protein [Pirellulaceae bacterium]
MWIPQGDGPFPLLLTQPRFYQIFWAEDAVKRGYIACLYPGLDVHHQEKDYPGYENVWRTFQAEYPEATWQSSLAIQAWLASRTLDYLLDPKYGYDVAPGQVGIVGFSRYGKQSLYAAGTSGKCRVPRPPSLASVPGNETVLLGSNTHQEARTVVPFKKAPVSAYAKRLIEFGFKKKRQYII